MSRFDFEPLTRGGSGDELLREVLGSARRDMPSPGAKERMFVAIDVAAPAPSTCLGLSTSLWRGIGLRHIGIGVAMVVGATTAVMTTTAGDGGERATPTTHMMAPVEAAPVAAAPVAEARAATDIAASLAPTEDTAGIGISAPPPRPEHTQSPRRHAGNGAVVAHREKAAAPIAEKAGAKAIAPSADSTLGREIARMGAARSALAGGNTGRALQLLDSYETEFPLGAFSVEVSVLRIEALARSGQVDEARRLGDQFLAQHPQGAFARRVAATLRSAALSNGD